MTTDSSPHKIVVVGGAYAGLSAVLNLLKLSDGNFTPLEEFPQVQANVKTARGVEITLIDERDGFFHTIATPLAHVSDAHVKTMWKRYNEVEYLRRPEVSVKQASVQLVNPETKTITYSTGDVESTLSYDYLIAATGLRRAFPEVPRATTFEEYVKDAVTQIEAIKAAKDLGVVVIGGGAVGIEFAGEIKAIHPSIPVKLIHSRGKLLSNEPLPEEYKDRALQVLQEEGVEVVLNDRVQAEQQDDGTWTLINQDGTKTTAGYVFKAFSPNKPSTNFLPAEVLGEKGLVKVDTTLRFPSTSPNAEYHYAAGDIIDQPFIKRCGPAMNLGAIAAVNIYAHILSQENSSKSYSPDGLAQFTPRGPGMSLAIGTQAVGFRGQVRSGKDLLLRAFGPDLGWTNISRKLSLVDAKEGGERL